MGVLLLNLLLYGYRICWIEATVKLGMYVLSGFMVSIVVKGFVAVLTDVYSVMLKLCKTISNNAVVFVPLCSLIMKSI